MSLLQSFDFNQVFYKIKEKIEKKTITQFAK